MKLRHAGHPHRLRPAAADATATPKPIRTLGEGLILFRDGAGQDPTGVAFALRAKWIESPAGNWVEPVATDGARPTLIEACLLARLFALRHFVRIGSP